MQNHQHDNDVYLISDADVPESPEELFRAVAGVKKQATRPAAARRPARSSQKRRAAPRPISQPVTKTARGSMRPLIASALSLFVCGAGQIFNRQGELGALFFLTEVLCLAGHWAIIRTWSSVRALAGVFGMGEGRLLLSLAGVDLLMVILVLAGVYQAYRRAESEKGDFGGLDVPFLPGLASLLLPGLGQLLNAQVGKALVFLFVLLSTVLGLGFLMLTPIAGIWFRAGLSDGMLRQIEAGAIGAVAAAVLMWILSFYDAVVVAGSRRQVR